MGAENTISIITPFYNSGDIFWQTYQTVISQSFKEWEWIIFNDGTNDPQSLEVLDKLASLKQPGIRIINGSQNQGLPAARNAGVKAAAGNLLFFLDSDDLIEPDYLEKAWIALTLNPSYSFVNSWSTGFGAKKYNWHAGFEKREKFLDQNWVAFAGLFRKSLLEKIKFNESRKEGLEDWEFWLEAASQGYWGYTIPERLFHYRIHPNSDLKWKNWDNGKRQQQIRKTFKKKYASILRKDFPSPQKAEYSLSIPVLPALNESVRTDTPTSHDKSMAKVKPLLMVILPWTGPGGVEQFTLNWMRALRKDFDFVLVTTNPSPDNNNNDFKEISQSVFHLAHLADSTLYPTLVNYLLNTRKPDLIVLSHAEPFYHLLPYIRSCFPRIPITDINHIEDMNWQEGGYPKIASIFTDYIDKHIVISEWLKKFMEAQGVDESKLETVYINTDTDSITPLDLPEKEALKAQLITDSGTQTIILFAGRLTQQKRVLIIPEIAEQLVKRKLSFRIVICGDGPDRDLLEEKIYKKGLTQHFQLTGGVPHQKIITYIQSADILLLPSEWEGIATVLYEAMAAGLPVVATDVGGQKELVTPDSGIIIQSHPEQEVILKMAEALEGLIREPALRAKLGQAARLRVSNHFDSKITYSGMRKIFASQIEKGPQALQIAPTGKSNFQNYQDFAGRWNILHPGNTRPFWKDAPKWRHLKRIYKVVAGKRPLVYLWKKT